MLPNHLTCWALALLLLVLVQSTWAAVPVVPSNANYGNASYIIENLLPTAEQTHEIVVVPNTDIVLISQLSNSVLVKAQVNKEGKVLKAAAFQFGSPASALHGLAQSHQFPGKIWITLQASNLILLIDPMQGNFEDVPAVLKEITVPKGKGPHYVGEYGDDLWVSLQDSDAVLRINHVNPEDYDHFPALPRPIFVAQHPINNMFYSSQDNSASIIKIDPLTKLTSQIAIASSAGTTPVGLIRGPLGVWFTLLGTSTSGTGTVGFIGADDQLTYHKLKHPLAKTASLLHLAFDLEVETNHVLWLLSSSIINSNALDMVIRVQFDALYKQILSEEVTVMPTQQCKAHRIVQTPTNIFATQLSTSKLLSYYK
ncbi:hypothetical protein BGZ94_008126 [Podila epigama]|nr:hypothetical protein BGZ94_008126 [Podila epigama]